MYGAILYGTVLGTLPGVPPHYCLALRSLCCRPGYAFYKNGVPARQLDTLQVLPLLVHDLLYVSNAT